MRLLTGIGRFHEMSYIIGLLLECDEFESLVHTGVEKVMIYPHSDIIVTSCIIITQYIV